jgi:hypothetical protein
VAAPAGEWSCARDALAVGFFVIVTERNPLRPIAACYRRRTGQGCGRMVGRQLKANAGRYRRLLANAKLEPCGSALEQRRFAMLWTVP